MNQYRGHAHQITFSCFLAITAICSSACADAFPASLRDDILLACDKIKSLHVVYEVEFGGGRDGSNPTMLSREIVAKSPHYMVHDSAKHPVSIDKGAAIERQHAVLDGEFVVNANPLNRVFFRSAWDPADGLPGTLPTDIFFLATGVWPRSSHVGFVLV